MVEFIDPVRRHGSRRNSYTKSQDDAKRVPWSSV